MRGELSIVRRFWAVRSAQCRRWQEVVGASMTRWTGINAVPIHAR
jgi:hypothetical protein